MATKTIQAYLLLKRTLDIIGSFSGLLLLSPLLLLTAVAIWLDSPGNPLFYQSRAGKDGCLFRCWKFRSMYRDAEQRKMALLGANEMQGGVIFKMRDDPRVTRVGRIIRRLSIDELPQLWNVLVGDMALVGPRPPIPDEVELYTPYQRQRLSVTPGITCIWQVSGRSNIPFKQQVEMDLEYIQGRCLRLDLALLLKTIPAVLTGRGAS